MWLNPFGDLYRAHKQGHEKDLAAESDDKQGHEKDPAVERYECEV